MKATKLIEILTLAVKQHGDLEVLAEDGCDPSDRVPVKSIQITLGPKEPVIEIYASCTT